MSLILNYLSYIYPIAATGIFLAIYLLSRLKIKKTEKSKLRSINKRKISDAVETESPLDDQEKNLRERGIHGIENRFSFISKALPLVIITLWLVAIFLPYLGSIPTAYISVITAICSVIIGISLRPFLENLFAGIIISFFKSIKIGDTVIIDKHYGLIEEIGLTYSVLKRWDWNRIVIPNSKLLQKEIQNLTMNDQFIWAYVEFYVAPNSDIEKVENIAKAAAKKSKYFSGAEEPTFWVMEMEKSAVKCWIAAWSNTPSDAWELRNNLQTELIKEFQKEKICLHEYQMRNNSM